jgi:deoxyguanosine kinase
MLENLKYIAIEGIIGAGKTDLANKVKDQIGGRLILDEHRDNPFLRDFYMDPHKHSFQTQLYFLVSRYKQQDFFHQVELFDKRIISDYLFVKNQIFSTVVLNDNEKAMYQKIQSMMLEKVSKPDLVIYLQCSVDLTIERLRSKDRYLERKIDPDYIVALDRHYNEFFFNYEKSPLLVIKTDKLDLKNNLDDTKLIIDEMKRMKGGVKYVVPA